MEKSAIKASRTPGDGPTVKGGLEAFGDFRILRKLGQGGMGEVYLAEQISLKRKVAIKMLRADVAANTTALARFESETTTIAKLSHANVVQAYMAGAHGDRHYLVMEYVDGISLAEYLERKGAMEPPLVLSILRQVASALQRASELGIVHRDIKPGNILITRKAEAKVADFGLSQCLHAAERVDLTREGATVGTPLYMSPEQIEGKDLDVRSDIYSLGVTAYHMLAGQPPFEGSNPYAIATKHMKEKPTDLEKVRPELPPALCDLVRKMMAKKPDARHGSARELLQEIARVKQALQGITPTLTMTVDADTRDDDADEEHERAPAIEMPIWRRPVFVGVLGGAVALGLAAFLVLGLAGAWFLRSAGDAEPRNEPMAQEPIRPVEPAPDPMAALQKQVDQILNDPTAKPASVDACIDLAVHYLDEKKYAEARLLFQKMTERRPPSAYYFVGRLGLGVVDAVNNDHKSARAKFTEVFEAKTKDNRGQIVNDILTRKPEFAAWVNEADAHIARHGAAERTLPKGMWRQPMFGKMPFRK